MHFFRSIRNALFGAVLLGALSGCLSTTRANEGDQPTPAARPDLEGLEPTNKAVFTQLVAVGDDSQLPTVLKELDIGQCEFYYDNVSGQPLFAIDYSSDAGNPPAHNLRTETDTLTDLPEEGSQISFGSEASAAALNHHVGFYNPSGSSFTTYSTAPPGDGSRCTLLIESINSYSPQEYFDRSTYPDKNAIRDQFFQSISNVASFFDVEAKLSCNPLLETSSDQSSAPDGSSLTFTLEITCTGEKDLPPG